MTAMLRLPHRDTLLAVLVQRVGLGWRVGIGPIAAGRPDEDHGAYTDERQAERVAIRLADERDLIVVQA